MVRYLIPSTMFLASSVLAESTTLVHNPLIQDKPAAVSARVMFTIRVFPARDSTGSFRLASSNTR